MKVITLLALCLSTMRAWDYDYVAGVECKAFRDCMEALPKGKVAATTVYLADIADYDAMNKIYETYFPGLKPARNTVQMKLPNGNRMAIQATIYRGAAALEGLTPPNVKNVVPITPAVLTPDRMFIAGILGRDSNTGKIPDTPEAQVEMCLGRLKNIFTSAGLTPQHLLQATVYHTAAIPRELIDKSLKDYKAAFTVVETPALALGAQIGIHGVALRTRPEVASIDAIVKALYTSISGPAGAPRDWPLLRYILHESAQFRTVRPQGGIASLTVDEYIERNGKALVETGFAEDELGRKVERFNGIAHVWSAFGIRRGASPDYVRKGVNSIQLYWDGTRWWVMNVYWDNDTGVVKRDTARAAPAQSILFSLGEPESIAKKRPTITSPVTQAAIAINTSTLLRVLPAL